MDSIIKKSIIIGLGLASLTKAKAAGFIKEVTKDDGLTLKEGGKLAKEILGKIADSKKILEDKIDKAVGRAMVRLDLPSRKEVHDLSKKIDRLERENAKKQI